MRLSIVIPSFNEQKTIGLAVDRVRDTLEKMASLITHWEIICVDDGSTDETKTILESFSKTDNRIRTVFKSINKGKGASLREAFNKTSGDIVLIQDSDLEYSPEDYQIILRPFFENKADVVYGSRFKGSCGRVLYFWHYCGNKFLTLLSNILTDLNLTDMETGYKAFKGDIIRNMILESNRFGIEPEMTAKIAKVKGIRIYEVPISYYGRTYEEGKKIGWKDGFSALWCIVKYNLLTNYNESFRVGKDKLIKQTLF